MLDLEDYISRDYSSYDSFYKCYPEDEVLITKLQESADNITPYEKSFSFFDIGLSKREVDLFFGFEAESFDCLVLTEDLYNLQTETEIFLEKFSYGDSKNKTISVQNGAKLIAKLIGSVIATSEYNSALVIIRALPNGFTEDIYMHRDKTSEEILSIDTNLFDNKYFFIFVLKGEGTLYFPFKKHEQETFNKYAKDDIRSFGYHVKELEKNLQEQFNTSECLSPNFGYGSVHLIGKYSGAVHATPLTTTGRLVLLIAPEEAQLLQNTDG